MMIDLGPAKAVIEAPLPASMPDWLCSAATDGSHASEGAFPQWWLDAFNSID
jgi:hypothetical protein